ncbi:MAG: transcriptional repressor [Lachnospiraceae bacterium]
MLKYSRQRESIKKFLMTRTDHPTAETIYENLRKEYPKISLGTVYRNLSLLTDIGEIQTISTGVGPDRFDGNAQPHYHFICKRCGRVLDLKMQGLEHINLLAQHEFSGSIEGHTVFFYGSCEECLTQEK